MSLIDNVLFALEKVPESYYKVINPQYRNDVFTSYSKDTTKNERSFMYRFYHELLCELKKDGSVDEFVLEAENYKKLLYSQRSEVYVHTFKKIFGDKPKNIGFRPDLVFHKGQECNKSNEQILALECTRKE